MDNTTQIGREEVLADCIRADEQWSQTPLRNIVIMFDGTGNILGNHQDTNVVKLMQRLEKSPSNRNSSAQIVYYDPGVGTNNNFPAESIAGRVALTVKRIVGLAFGGGVFENIAEAYLFLINNYREGDRIFLFGFSRGAFTARALAGILNSYGIIRTSGIALIPSIVQNYFSGEKHRTGLSKRSFAEEICTHFTLGQRPLVHFVGVWDTVETIGSGFFGGLKITNAPDLAAKRYRHVRHALALHESRCKYEPRTYEEPSFTTEESKYRSFDQRWFRGVHSDIGGSYNRDGLSNITLNWMMEEAKNCGIRLDDSTKFSEHPTSPMHDETYESPFWVWTGLSARPRNLTYNIDRSALPISQSSPAANIPRKNSFFPVLGFLLLIATAVLIVLTESQFVAVGRTTSEFFNRPYVAALFPAFINSLTQDDIRKFSSARDSYILCELFLLITVSIWLAFPMTFATRRLVACAIPEGRAIPYLIRNSKYVMLVCLAGAAAKIFGEIYLDFSWGRGIAFAGTIFNLAALLGLVAIFFLGLFAFPKSENYKK